MGLAPKGLRSCQTSSKKLFSPEVSLWMFHDEGPYHIETSPLICSANQWIGFYDRDIRHEIVKYASAKLVS